MENRSPAKRARSQTVRPRANPEARPSPHSWSADLQAFRHRERANRPRCCRARCAAPSPRSNRPSRRCRTSSGVVVMMMVTADTDPADVMMVPRLRRTCLVLVADDLRPVLAQLAIHRRLTLAKLGDPFAERLEYPLVIAQINRFDELDFPEQSGDAGGLRIDAFDQNAGEQKIGKDDYAAETEPGRPRQCSVDPRMGNAAEGGLCPAEAHAFPQHAGELRDVRIGIRI